MSQTKHLIPKAGRVVIDPATLRMLPAEGALVPLTSYWLRRLADGDVTERASTSKPVKTNTSPQE